MNKENGQEALSKDEQADFSFPLNTSLEMVLKHPDKFVFTFYKNNGENLFVKVRYPNADKGVGKN